MTDYIIDYGRFKRVKDKPINSIEVHAFHGFLGLSSDFDVLETELSIALKTHDLIGHGSHISDDEQEFSTDKQCQYWQEHLPQGSILLGYSMGGRLALQIACSAPNQLKGLILVGASAGLSAPIERAKRQEWDYAMARSVEEEMDAFLIAWTGMEIIASQQNIEGKHLQKMQENRRRQDPEMLANSMRSFGTGTMPSCWEELSKVDIPVLLLTGEHDLKYRKIAEEMQEKLPKSQMFIVENTGHCCHLEAPIQTARIIEKWLLSQF
jgi:2-succinyl-6-hydroxy-2,4-cyclohexadiene-1-carboxylate synthase